MKNLIKLSNKILEHDFEIIFGVLSGTGLVVILTSLISWFNIILHLIGFYSFLIYSVLFLTALFCIAKYYTKGLFRIIFTASSLILFGAQIYFKLFEVVN